MAIFNSLGSNYSGKFILRSLFWPGGHGAKTKLEELLGERYGGSVALTYKGRQALELAVRGANLPQGSTVGINGFTCYVVYQAVERAGYKPVFIDVASKQLNFGVEELRTAHKNNPNLKTIIVQNTLGLVADMLALEAYCKQHNITIIEDLAHSFGARYSDGREVGTVGQFTMLSFSQDKPLDVVAGGAVVNRSANSKSLDVSTHVGLWLRFKNRLYPFWTSLIRATYSFGLGRILHTILKKLHFMSTPMGDNLQGIQQMTDSAAGLLISKWDSASAELSHRQRIAAIYTAQLPKEIMFSINENSQPLYLRFPLWVEDRKSLVAYLKRFHIYIGDTWYDAPIGPKRYLPQTSYQQGSCSNAEALAQHIVNLPTHTHVNEKDVEFIAGKVKTWLKSK